MNALRNLLASLFSKHKWETSGPEQRTCSVCERTEQLVDDGWGPQWVMDKAGDAGKHHGGGK
jgi:hypothetical protein